MPSILSVAAALALLAAPHQAGTLPRGLDGTFLQLAPAHVDWPRERWTDLFDDLRDLGLQQIVVQWTVLDNTAFYRSARFTSVESAPLESILQEAERHNMSVRLGLVQQAAYWSQIGGEPPALSGYFDRLRADSLSAANELLALVATHKCVTGWYLPEEIDDLNWQREDSREVLLRHIADLALALKQLTPRLTISISTFAQGRWTPIDFQNFWTEFLQRARIDTVFLQDGVGVNKLRIGEVALYMNALRSATAKNKRQASAIVELLSQTAGIPINAAPFQAVPAPLSRIAAQIEALRGYSPDDLIGFSVPEYMTPLGGPQAAELFDNYRRVYGTALRHGHSGNATGSH